MDAYLTHWLNLVLRWIHVIVGIAWIGTSFYFNWLNRRLERPAAPEPGVGGEMWSVHGGGFYRVVKYDVAPNRLPDTLHWFKWEAYATWITGFALLVLIYYLGADAFLLDASVSGVRPAAAVVVSLVTLAGGWLVYDALCRTSLVHSQLAFTLTALGLVLATTFGLTRIFSSRGAYIHVGAMLGTLMAANVFRVIIPQQKEMVRAIREQRVPDAALGRKAALRAVHNNYMTLPVLFIMVSNHYPFTYGHPYNWAILAALAVVGVGVRHYFNLRNRQRQHVWILPAAAVAIVGLAFVTAPRIAAPGTQAEEPVTFAEVHHIIQRRCTPCHSARPTQPGFPVAPLGVVLDTPEQISRHLEQIRAVAIETQTMPLANLTGMTPDERTVLARWMQQGASID